MAENINHFLITRTCSTGGKHAYFRAIRAFIGWLIRYDYLQDNPLTKIDPPKPGKRILPSLTREQVEYLMERVDNVRDKVIIALLNDSGIRLGELANIQARNISWEHNTVTVWGKGSKQRKAPFTERTATLLKQYISQDETGGNIWGINANGIRTMLRRLAQDTGLPCNPHTFRRTFASNLHRAGMDIEHIMRLGGWESLDMVIRYTRSVKFEESLEHYHRIANGASI
ncbi:tyrosine-type recombinase/integrase [Chloroflexota bacterium]